MLITRAVPASPSSMRRFLRIYLKEGTVEAQLLLLTRVKKKTVSFCPLLKDESLIPVLLLLSLFILLRTLLPTIQICPRKENPLYHGILLLHTYYDRVLGDQFIEKRGIGKKRRVYCIRTYISVIDHEKEVKKKKRESYPSFSIDTPFI